MIERACRFNDVMKCLVHDSQGIGNICDIGVAELRAELERVKKEYVQASTAARKSDEAYDIIHDKLEQQARVIAGLHGLLIRLYGANVDTDRATAQKEVMEYMSKLLSPKEA